MKNLQNPLKTVAYITLCLSALYFVAGCGGGGGTSVDSAIRSDATTNIPANSVENFSKWTILVYMDADNNLEPYAMQNLNEMEKIGSNDSVKIVVQIDRAQGYDDTDGDWSDTRRYLIQRDTDPQKLNSVRLDAQAPLGELDMADPDNLRDFVEWGARTFPAEHFAVILWNHGTGWELTPAVAAKFRPNYVLSDDSSGNAMNITDIAYAFSSFKPDILAFDACYMQQVEVAYQLRNCADYMIGSTGAEPTGGFRYEKFLSQIGAGTTPLQLGKSIVKTYVDAYKGYSGIMLSMVDLSQMDDVADSVREFASTLQSNQSEWKEFIEQARAQSIDYAQDGAGKSRYLIDMVDYAKKCSTMLGGSVTASSAQLTESIKRSVVAEGHGSDSPNATGLSIYFPENGKYNSSYSSLDFARVTNWDMLISTL